MFSFLFDWLFSNYFLLQHTRELQNVPSVRILLKGEGTCSAWDGARDSGSQVMHRSPSRGPSDDKDLVKMRHFMSELAQWPHTENDTIPYGI